MISRTRRDSAGGGSRRIFPSSPRADAIQWGGVVAEFFRDLQLRNQMFTPHSVIFVGRDTHFA